MKKLLHSLAFILIAIFCPLISKIPVVQAETSDPLEPLNRKIFWFNDKIDTHVLVPVCNGYKAVFPAPIRKHVQNFFGNAKTPIYVVSDLVQLKFEEAGTHLGRFFINSTLGFLGLVDVASSFNMKHENEDFGIALGYQGVAEGPYLVLPFLGPSNLRDGFGRIIDAGLNPTLTLTSTEAGWGLYVLEGIDSRARLLEAVDTAKDASVDYYGFIKSTYHQVRQNLIYDGNPPEEEYSEE